MDATVIARARSAINPFVLNRVDSAWDPEAVDVEAINRTAFERCGETIELVRATGQSRGLLLSGQPGSGKTHLLQRLRRRVQRDGRDCFVYVPPVSGPDRFFRDLLQHAVRDLAASRTGSRSNQLESLLVRELLQFGRELLRIEAKEEEPLTAATFWAKVRQRHAPGQALCSWLERPMQQLGARLDLDPDVTRVLRHYLAEHHRDDAYSWLLGRSVPDAVLERLGIGRTLEDDAEARQTLGMLSRLAAGQPSQALTPRANSVLVMAFDQLEGLQVDEKDLQGLQAFAVGVANLFVTCRNIATISCVQTYFMADLTRAVPAAHIDRLAQDQGALSLLERATAVALVAERLGAVNELREAREALGEQDPLWPLNRGDVERFITAGGIPARQLLKNCRDLFDQWRSGQASLPPTRETLEAIWDGRVERTATEPADEGVLADGLLKLIDVRKPGACRRGTVKDIDLVVTAPDGEIGVAVCHARNMTSLAARLKRLQSAAESRRFVRLVLVRDERLPISPKAKTVRERLDALRQAGHVLLRPSAEAWAAIAAARQLLAEAAAGDLSVNGTAVAPADLKEWLAGHLSRPADQLLRDSDGPVSAQTDDIVDRIVELLEGQWIVSAADIAASMGLNEGALVRNLTTDQHAIGMISGSPTVLFLRPEGVRRD